MSERLGCTPSQTVGPYLHIVLPWPDGPFVVPEGTSGAFWVTGRLLDGAGEPIPDGLIETWQADPAGRFDHPDDPRGATKPAIPGFRGFGRSATGANGEFGILTVKPGPVPAEDGRAQAPHIHAGQRKTPSRFVQCRLHEIRVWPLAREARLGGERIQPFDFNVFQLAALRIDPDHVFGPLVAARAHRQRRERDHVDARRGDRFEAVAQTVLARVAMRLSVQLTTPEHIAALDVDRRDAVAERSHERSVQHRAAHRVGIDRARRRRCLQTRDD